METLKILDAGAGKTLSFAREVCSLAPEPVLFISTDYMYSAVHGLKKFFLFVKSSEKTKELLISGRRGCFRSEGFYEKFPAPDNSLDMVFINCWHIFSQPDWDLFQKELSRCLKKEGIVFWSHPVDSIPELRGFLEIHKGSFRENRGDLGSIINLRERIKGYPESLPYKIPLTKTMRWARQVNRDGCSDISYIYRDMFRPLLYGVLVKE